MKPIEDAGGAEFDADRCSKDNNGNGESESCYEEVKYDSQGIPAFPKQIKEHLERKERNFGKHGNLSTGAAAILNIS